MRRKKLLHLLATMLVIVTLIPAAVKAQNFTVKGTVKDAQGNSLQGVSVNVKGKSGGTTTVSDGSFSIQVPGSGTLEFSSVGFKTQTIAVKSEETIAMILEESASQLADVVVVGYGTQKKSIFFATF